MARYWQISLFLILLLVGCGRTPEVGTEPPAAEVAESELELGELEKDGDFTYGEPIVEWVRVLNCDNPVARSDVLQESRTIERKITWSVEGELGGFAGIGAGVEGKIASGYQLEVSEQIERSRAIELPVQPYSSVEYPIEWQTLVWSGRLPFKLGSAEGRIRYFYTRHLFGEVVAGFRDRTQEDCGAIVLPSPTTPSETPIHTSVPERASATPTLLVEPIESSTPPVTTQAPPVEQGIAGEIGSDIPGIPLQLSVPVTSVIDADTKPRDVYSISLNAGDSLRIAVEASGGIYADIVKPGALTIDDGDSTGLCGGSSQCTETFNVATTGTYYLAVFTRLSGVAYTLTANALVQGNSGEVASEIPGTPLQLGAPVTSVIDVDTKPRDVYSISLNAGDSLRIAVEASGGIYAEIVKPGALTIDDGDSTGLCGGSSQCTETFNVATTGTYYLAMFTRLSGVAYTLTANALVQGNSGEVASEIPGTPLQLGAPVTSVIDVDTKPRDVYSVSLNAGDSLRIAVEASGGIYAEIVKPGALTIDDGDSTGLCGGSSQCTETFNVATTGTYYLAMFTRLSGVAYTLQVNAQ